VKIADLATDLAEAKAARANGNGHKPPSEDGPRFFTPRELRRHTPDRPDFVWDPYAARGAVTLVAGLPKVGKSTLTCALSEAVRSSVPSFLGGAVSGGPVVIISEENAVTALAKLGDSDNVLLLVREHAWPLPSWPALIAVAVTAAKRIGAVLLVIDSFSFFAQLGPDAENDSGAVNRVFAPLHEAAASGLALVLPLHQRKSGGEGGTAIRGSGAIAANADMLVEVERLGENASPRHRQLVAIGRWAAPPLLVVDYDPGTGSWCVVGEGEGRGDAASVSWRDRVIKALPAREPGATYPDLEGALGADKRKWAPTLSVLVADRLVATAGEGVRGDPKRFWRAIAESVPSFRPEAGTETDGNVTDDSIRIPSPPYRGTESNTSVNGNASPIPSTDRNGNPPERTVADLSDDELLAVFPGSELIAEDERDLSDDGSEMAF